MSVFVNFEKIVTQVLSGTKLEDNLHETISFSELLNTRIKRVIAIDIGHASSHIHKGSHRANTMPA